MKCVSCGHSENGKFEIPRDQPDEETTSKNAQVANVKNYIIDFCTNGTMHGFRYFGENRTRIEKIWWLFGIAISLSFCVYLINNIYIKWENSPLIVSFATQLTPISEIPFPAVTVCPEAKSVQSVFNYSDVAYKILNNETVSAEEYQQFDYMSLLCDKDPPKADFMKGSIGTSKFFDFIDKIKPDFFNYTKNCRLLGFQMSCEKIFYPIITDLGICYTFNMLDRNGIFSDLVVHYKHYNQIISNKTANWSIEDGYGDHSDPYARPIRAFLAGASQSLSFNLITPKNTIDTLCTNFQGFRVVLHAPMRLPRLTQEYFRVPLNQGVVVTVLPAMIITSSAVRKYHPKKRGCYFATEKKLKYFRDYSQLNCQLECLTNYTFNVCDCVGFYMPREETMRICSAGDQLCMKMAENSYRMSEIRVNLGTDVSEDDCDCMPLCTDLSYSKETSQASIDEEMGEFPQNHHHTSRVEVYFKVNHFVRSERNELYGPTDFVANFGGLLGLFTGFSILSLIEIIYYLTLRIVCNVRLYGTWHGQ